MLQELAPGYMPRVNFQHSVGRPLLIDQQGHSQSLAHILRLASVIYEQQPVT
jgi:hypothetical protein